MVGDSHIDVVHSYRYFGVVLNEFLDYSEMAKSIASSAGRALGLLIAMSKLVGGFQYTTFTRLYDSTVLITVLQSGVIALFPA
jgi:hypothetical protein